MRRLNRQRSNLSARSAYRYTLLAAMPVVISLGAGCANSATPTAVAASTVASSTSAVTSVAPTIASPTATPIVTDPNSVVATVDCGDDGVANVTAQFGTGKPDKVLVGRNATTLGAGGQGSFSRMYGTSKGLGDGTLVVTTAPTSGTCTTTLTEYDGGTVIAERSSAGKVTLTAIVRES